MSITNAAVKPKLMGKIKLDCEDRMLAKLYSGSLKPANQGQANILAYEKEWKLYPESFDFLARSSPLFRLKQLEKEIYLQLIGPYLKRLPKGSRVIDAGAGIGRFAGELLSRGFRVDLVDSSRQALEKAYGHLAAKKAGDFILHWADAGNLSMFKDETFAAGLALELVCYLPYPRRVVSEIARVTKTGGLIFFSVEGKCAGLVSDPHVALEDLGPAVRRGALETKGLYVNYYTPRSIRGLLEGCGIKVLALYGSHYITDGVFHGLLDLRKMAQKKYCKKILALERTMRNDPEMSGLARSWVAIGRKR